MAFGHRVRDERIGKGLTQQQLADLVGVNQPVIGSIESRDSETSKHASKIAAALAVSLDWLLTGKTIKTVAEKKAVYESSADTRRNDTQLLDDDDVLLPFYSTAQLAVDNDLVAFNFQKGQLLRFSKQFLRDANVNFDDAIMMRVSADNMERLILDGATIAVDTSKASIAIKDNRIYALETDGNLHCKYIQKMAGGRVKLISENNMYDDEVYDMTEFLRLYRIIGWVFWWSTLAKW